MSDKLSILPASAITAGLLSAYAVSKERDHSQCTPTKCLHEREDVAEVAAHLADACNASPAFQSFVAKYVEETVSEHFHGPRGPMQAMAGMSIFFVYVGWELAQHYLDGQAMEKMVQ